MNKFVRKDGDDPFVQNNAEAAPAMYGHLNAIVDELNKKASLPLFGTAAPTVKPNFIGEIFINTSGPDVYIATGLTSSDWLQL